VSGYRHVSLPSHANVNLPSHMTALTKLTESIAPPCGSYPLQGPNTRWDQIHSQFISNYED